MNTLVAGIALLIAVVFISGFILGSLHKQHLMEDRLRFLSTIEKPTQLGSITRFYIVEESQHDKMWLGMIENEARKKAYGAT